MIAPPDPAFLGLAAGTLSAFVLGGGLLRSVRQRTRQSRELTALRTELDRSRRAAERTVREAVQRADEAERGAGALLAEITHLAAERLPAAATRATHTHVTVPGPLDPERTAGEAAESLDAVLDGLLAALAKERKRVDAAARAGMRGTTREIQAGLYRIQDALRSLQQRYDDPELTRTLFALDHENEQSLRRAQVAAVVCGAWVGLARQESHLVDAVTGGQARLVGYQRVKVHNHLEDGTALVSHAVEPVAIIVAELLDNALRHSATDTSVTVHLERAHHGVTVTVDDAGVGMASDERAWAQRMVAGSDPILLSELGDPPRMGLAAIGQLTRQFDLSVDLSSPSPYGGVRAVLLVRSHLLSRIDPAVRPPAASAPRSTRTGGAAEAAAQDPSGRTRRNGSGPGVPFPAGPGGTRTRTTAFPSLPAPAPPVLPPAAAPAVTVPNQAVTPAVTAPAAPNPPAATVPVPAPARPETITHEPAALPDGDELPRRRRRVRSPEAAPAAAARTPFRRPSSGRTPEEAAAALGALQAGTAAARLTPDAADTERNTPR
jgi:signal transduction histidine kinase